MKHLLRWEIEIAAVGKEFWMGGDWERCDSLARVARFQCSTRIKMHNFTRTRNRMWAVHSLFIGIGLNIPPLITLAIYLIIFHWIIDAEDRPDYSLIRVFY